MPDRSGWSVTKGTTTTRSQAWQPGNDLAQPRQAIVLLTAV